LSTRPHAISGVGPSSRPTSKIPFVARAAIRWSCRKSNSAWAKEAGCILSPAARPAPNPPSGVGTKGGRHVRLPVFSSVGPRQFAGARHNTIPDNGSANWSPHGSYAWASVAVRNHHIPNVHSPCFPTYPPTVLQIGFKIHRDISSRWPAGSEDLALGNVPCRGIMFRHISTPPFGIITTTTSRGSALASGAPTASSKITTSHCRCQKNVVMR